MSIQSVFCVVSSRGRADRIIVDLKAAGFSSDELAVLFLDLSPARDFTREISSGVAAGAIAQSGRAIRGVLGWIDGIKAVTLPGLGTLIAAGPFVAAVSSPAGGSMDELITRSLIGLGVSPPDAARYEAQIKDGNILVLVYTADPAKISRAQDIFTTAHS